MWLSLISLLYDLIVAAAVTIYQSQCKLSMHEALHEALHEDATQVRYLLVAPRIIGRLVATPVPRGLLSSHARLCLSGPATQENISLATTGARFLPSEAVPFLYTCAVKAISQDYTSSAMLERESDMDLRVSPFGID